MKGAARWLLHRITGILLFAGLVVHFSVMHFSGSSQITEEFVTRRISSPYWKAFDLAFLSSAIFHGFNGLWGIAIEYVGRPGWLKLSRTAILASAAMLMIAGIYIVTLR